MEEFTSRIEVFKELKGTLPHLVRIYLNDYQFERTVGSEGLEKLNYSRTAYLICPAGGAY